MSVTVNAGNEPAVKAGDEPTISRRTLLKQASAGVAAVTLGGSIPRVFAQVRRPIRIGVSLPLTGEFAEPGRNMQQGYQLWADLINARGGLLGRRVELLIQDNRSNTETAVAQYERFINVDRVDLLFSTFSSLLTFPTSAVAERYEMVYPIAAGGAERIYNRGFKYIFYFQQELAEGVADSYFQLLEYYRPNPFPKTLGVTYADDFFANAIAEGIPRWAERLGIEIVHFSQFPLTATDYLSIVNPLRTKNPDYWLAPMASYQQGVNLIRAAQTMQYNPIAVGMSTAPLQDEFFDTLGSAANGVMAHSAWHPSIRYQGPMLNNVEFVELFTKTYGEEPNEDNAIPFAIGQGIQYAVEQTQTLDNRVLRDFLASRTAEDPVPTILGPFYWDERGAPLGAGFLVLQWQDGKRELIWPPDPEVKTADLLWPKPRW